MNFEKYTNSSKKIINSAQNLALSKKHQKIAPIHIFNELLNSNHELINKIFELSERIVDKNLINFTIQENDNKINIFFDNQSYDLIGWQNTDIYQNFNITFLSSIRKNRVLSKNLFEIPKQN